MRRKLALFILLFLNMTVFGQHEFGLKLNLGLSKISKEIGFDYPANTSFKVKSEFSGQGGIFYNIHLSDKLVFGSEFLFIQIEGRDRLEFTHTDFSSEYLGQGSNEVHEHISYLGLPVYCGLIIKRITINAGFQLSYVLVSSGKETYYYDTIGDIYSGDNELDNLPIDKFDFGPRIGIIYNINERFAIEGVFYYGINNILKNQGFEFPSSHKIQQVTIGLCYSLFKDVR